MNKAYKFRLYPNKQQQDLFAKTFGCTRFVYNKMLSDKINHYQETQKLLKVTPAQYKSEFEWLKEVDSLALTSEWKHLETAYKNFFRDKSIGFPKFKSKHRDKKSYTTNCVNNNIRIEDKYLVLPKLGKVRIKQHRPIPNDYKLKSCTISQTPTGKYFAAILFKYEEQIQLKPIEKIVGLDFSMTELFVSSDGEFAHYPRYYRRSLDRLKKQQRKLSKCNRNSKNYRKQKYKVSIIHEQIANQRRDFLHKKSKQIANAYDLVAVEDLNMKAMQQALNFGKSVSDNAWGSFLSYLAYKLSQAGKYFVKIDKWFPSSKQCSVCGSIKDKLLLSERTYVCDCGNVLNRDINAALNIRNEGLKLALS